MKILSRIYMSLIFALLYAPIIIIVVFSFNRGETFVFTEFSLYWYKELFHDRDALSSLLNSVILALSSSAIATVIGTLGAYGIDRMRSRFVRETVRAVTNIPMMNPDIVTGVSMMLLFAAVMSIQFLHFEMGFATMLIAHTTFILPYVVLSVLPKFGQMDPHLSEAALDLGCTPAQTFFKVELPYITPGILSGFLLGLTLSLDDFVVSYFVQSPSFNTLPIYVYNQTLHKLKPSIYALFALMVFAILLLMILVNFSGADNKKNKKEKKKKAA